MCVRTACFNPWWKNQAQKHRQSPGVNKPCPGLHCKLQTQFTWSKIPQRAFYLVVFTIRTLVPRIHSAIYIRNMHAAMYLSLQLICVCYAPGSAWIIWYNIDNNEAPYASCLPYCLRAYRCFLNKNQPLRWPLSLASALALSQACRSRSWENAAGMTQPSLSGCNL